MGLAEASIVVPGPYLKAGPVIRTRALFQYSTRMAALYQPVFTLSRRPQTHETEPSIAGKDTFAVRKKIGGIFRGGQDFAGALRIEGNLFPERVQPVEF